MRSVMDVAGSCADGGPHVSVQPCPGGAGFVGFAVPWGSWPGWQQLLRRSISPHRRSACWPGRCCWAPWGGTSSPTGSTRSRERFRAGSSAGSCSVSWRCRPLVLLVPRFVKLGLNIGGSGPENSAKWWTSMQPSASSRWRRRLVLPFVALTLPDSVGVCDFDWTSPTTGRTFVDGPFSQDFARSRERWRRRSPRSCV